MALERTVFLKRVHDNADRLMDKVNTLARQNFSLPMDTRMPTFARRRRLRRFPRTRRFPVERAGGRCAFDWKPARSRRTTGRSQSTDRRTCGFHWSRASLPPVSARGQFRTLMVSQAARPTTGTAPISLTSTSVSGRAKM